jgi:hypothetical protein
MIPGWETCPVCRTAYRVNRDGRMRRHYPNGRNAAPCSGSGLLPNRMEGEVVYRIGDDRYRIDATSCRCGGSWAWLRERPSGAWEMVGCICHHLPTGERL